MVLFLTAEASFIYFLLKKLFSTKSLRSFGGLIKERIPCSSFFLHLSIEMIMTKLKVCKVVAEQALEEVWTIMQLQTHAVLLLLQRPVWNTMEI